MLTNNFTIMERLNKVLGMVLLSLIILGLTGCQTLEVKKEDIKEAQEVVGTVVEIGMTAYEVLQILGEADSISSYTLRGEDNPSTMVWDYSDKVVRFKNGVVSDVVDLTEED